MKRIDYFKVAFVFQVVLNKDGVLLAESDGLKEKVEQVVYKGEIGYKIKNGGCYKAGLKYVENFAKDE